MAYFDAQIQDLVGTGFTDQTAMDTWMTDGVKEVINSMPTTMLELCSSIQSFTSAEAGSESETLNTTKISGVTLDGEPCRLIPAALKNKVSNIDEMDYATLTDPVYYVEGNKINALPSVGTCKYSEVQYTSVNASDVESISNFPDEAEYLVVLYAAIKALHQQMNSKSADLPSDVNSIVLSTTSESLPTFTAPDSFVIPVAPAGADVDFSSVPSAPSFIKPILSLTTLTEPTDLTIDATLPVAPSSPSFTYSTASVSDIVAPLLGISDKAALTASAPAYTKPAFVAASLSSISDLSISAASPVAPALTSVTFTSIDSALDITAPLVTTATVSASSQYAGSAPTYTSPVVSPDFAKVNTYIDTDEDTELAGAKLQEISTQIQEFSTNIQNELNKFNKENVAYQAAMQEVQIANQVSLSQAQSDLQAATSNKDRDLQRQLQNGVNDMQAIMSNNQDKLSIYQSQLQDYQSKVNTEVQEFTNNYQKNIQIFQADNQTKLSEFQVNVQSELNEFNKENIAYQEDIGRKTENFQKEIQQAIHNTQRDFDTKRSNLDKDVQINLQNAINAYREAVDEYESSLGKYSSELQAYQAQVGTEVQKYTVNEIQKQIGIWNTNIQSDLNQYSSDIQNESSKVNSDMSVYSQEIQKALQKYQAETGYDLSKYGAEIQAQSQKFASDLQKNTDTFRTSMEKYVSEVNKVSSDNRDKLSVYGADIQNYSSKIQKHGIDYQWLQYQHQQLSNDYVTGLQLLRSGTLPQQQ